MRKQGTYFLIVTSLIFVQTKNLFAQNTSKQKIAVFVPLYLDSAFDAYNTYRYDKNFPKFINPGLEFYEGCSLLLFIDRENTASLYTIHGQYKEFY
jgi:hypothetical protein